MKPLIHFTLLLLPLLPYIGIVGGIVLCVCLFLSLKREVHRARRHLDEKETMAAAALESFEARIEVLKQNIRELEERGVTMATASPGTPLNLTKRTQVLRMVRRGADQADIASTLHLPRGEVDLLVKVHKLSAGQRITAT